MSLGEEIAKLSNPTPQILDPEDDDPDTSSKVASFEESKNVYQKSELRSRTAPLLEDIDPTYTGRKVSRKSLGLIFDKVVSNESLSDYDKEDSEDNSTDHGSESFEADTTDDENDDDISDDNISRFTKNLKNKSLSNIEHSKEEDSSDYDDEDEQKDNMISQFSHIDVTSEIEKGKAVKAQQEIWNKLCEGRIKLQKLLIISNKLPQTDSWQTVENIAGEEMFDVASKANDSVKLLLNSLTNLQYELRKRSKKEMQEKASENVIPSESDEEPDNQEDDLNEENEIGMKRKCKNEDYSDILSKQFKSDIPYRNAVIQKWDEKVRLSTGRMNQKSFNAFGNSAVKQIEQILQDKNRLVRRTQLKRSVYRVLGKPEFSDCKGSETFNEQNTGSKQDMLLKDYDPQIFDDDDFYRQLLKDIIQNKSFGVDPSIVRKQMELQKIRNKMKRKVDTKASKGRKIRYDVHPKLVNYMAPVQTTTMSDEARENLLKCLFGKSTLQ